MVKSLDIIKKTNFGEPDGLFDPHLEEYFLDNNYWNDIIESNKFYVIGRKGTGKSALYKWIKNREYEKNVSINNLSFNEFPFEKLLKLYDNDFSRPNQYQSIWKNIILSEIASMIINNVTSYHNEDYNLLQEYINIRFGNDFTDLHRQVTTSTKKTEAGLQPYGIGFKKNYEDSTQIGDYFSNISQINKKLEETIINYVSQYPTTPYYIQFDQLDDNYTLYIDRKSYFEALISLFKVLYKLNLTFREKNVNIKILAYIRSDIFYNMNTFDPESSRWENFRYNLNWSIRKAEDWYNSKLIKVINKRLKNSTEELIEEKAFFYVFNPHLLKIYEKGKRYNPFRYIVHRTFQRPRDLIQFCIKIQDIARETNSFDARVIYLAEKEYSQWLLGEISNEIGPQIKSTETLFNFLRTLGDHPFTSQQFISKFKSSRNENINKSPEALLRYLYKLGVINNINIQDEKIEFFSVIRNERSSYDENLLAVIHPGLIKGLNTYKVE